MRKHLKDAIIVVLFITLIGMIFFKTHDFDYYLGNSGTSSNFNCEVKDIKDINGMFILYENNKLYYNDINECKLIQENVKSFAKFNQQYIFTDTGIKKITGEQVNSDAIGSILSYEQAYNNIKNDYDKIINVDSRGFALKGNKIYYFDSTYTVSREITSLELQYDDDSKLKLLVEMNGIEDIFYSIRLNKLLVKTENKYYEMKIDLNEIKEDYKLIIDSKFTANYYKIDYLNDGYMVYNGKIWEW